MRGMYCVLLCRWALMPCAEESSWLSAEGSKVSLAAGAGALEQERSGYGQRRAAIPAANRAMLDGQVSWQARSALSAANLHCQLTMAQTSPVGNLVSSMARIRCGLHISML